MSTSAEPPVLSVVGSWEELFHGPGRTALEAILPDYLRQRRWFGGRTRTIRSATLRGAIPIPCPGATVFYNLVLVEYAEGAADLYALPLTFAGGPLAENLLDHVPQAVLARLEGAVRGVLFDALAHASFANVLLEAMRAKHTFRAGQGEICATVLETNEVNRDADLTPRMGQAEQSNTSIIFGDKVILKCLRRLEEGVSLDLEIGVFLTQAGFPHTAPVKGAIEFRHDLSREPMTLAILHGFVPNQGDVWQHTLKRLNEYYAAILAAGLPKPDLPVGHPLDLAEAGGPPAHDYFGSVPTSAILLGQRTAELHLALAQGREPPFAPEPFTAADRQALYQSLLDLHGRVFDLLRGRLPDLPEAIREEARQVLDRSVSIPDRLSRILEGTLAAQRIRCHGDYHLGQVLFTGQDFVIIDFEGEPARPLAERRRKTSPLRDVAGMMRSFHYAAYFGLPANHPDLAPWAQFWYLWISAAFLQSYLATARGESILPASRPELELLLDTFLLEKAMYELAYELNHRPDWVRIPLRGIGQLLGL